MFLFCTLHIISNKCRPSCFPLINTYIVQNYTHIYSVHSIIFYFHHTLHSEGQAADNTFYNNVQGTWNCKLITRTITWSYHNIYCSSLALTPIVNESLICELWMCDCDMCSCMYVLMYVYTYVYIWLLGNKCFFSLFFPFILL